MRARYVAKMPNRFALAAFVPAVLLTACGSEPTTPPKAPVHSEAIAHETELVRLKLTPEAQKRLGIVTERVGTGTASAMRMPLTPISGWPMPISTARARRYVLDYLAMLVQAPGRKVHYALLIRGGQGTGKSWIGRLMTTIIGVPNVVFPSNDEVLSRWTIWTEGSCLAVIEELMARGRLDMANRLKPIITEPTLRIEEKKRSIYSIPNHLNLIGFTNHEDALPIETGDRRWLVISSNMKPMDEAYYERLFAFLKGDGPASVKHYLLNRKVQLNPKGMAPNTRGKMEMRQHTLSEAEQYLAELLEGREGPFAFDLVRLEELTGCIPVDLKRHVHNVRTKVAAWLRDEVGAVKHTRYTKGDRPACQLWSVRNHSEWEAAGAAARAEAFQSRYGSEVDS